MYIYIHTYYIYICVYICVHIFALAVVSGAIRNGSSYTCQPKICTKYVHVQCTHTMYSDVHIHTPGPRTAHPRMGTAWPWLQKFCVYVYVFVCARMCACV